jgi:serine protease Do
MFDKCLHRRLLASLALALGLALAAPAGAETSRQTILLKDGSRIEGEILRKKADRVVVDLGFTVVSVPSDEIEQILDAGGIAAQTESAGDLYYGAPGQPELTVKENVDRCGEAVLQVQTSIGLGSGFGIHADGYVVTNHHVISGEHQITATLFRKTDRELQKVQFDQVRIVATNPHVDLALLKIEDLGDRELPVVPLGDSDGLLQGQTVFSIGSPLGFDRTVSQGIVSIRNRPLDGHLFIQSTTQINPGNSGGPLFNLRGEVVGVNNMKIGAAGIEGLSFSIPSNALKAFLENIDAFAFDARNPNAGFRYNSPPAPGEASPPTE